MDFFSTKSRTCSVAGALSRAVDNLTGKIIVRGDIDWRHVMLLPVLDSSRGNNARVVDTKPLLIDMASVNPAMTAASAHEQMQDRVNE